MNTITSERNFTSLLHTQMIEHAWVEEAIKRMNRVFHGAREGGDPRCLAVLGESGTGKTRVMEHFTRKYPTSRESTGLKNPVLYLRTPSRPTVKGLASELLNKLGDELFEKGTEHAKTNRLCTLISNTGTRMLILDEFQHFVDQANLKVQHHVADWLKILVEDTKIGLVVCGLPYCTAVFETNSQLKRRFQRTVEMPRFNWLWDDHRNEFRSILLAMTQILSPFEFPQIEDEEVAFRFYCATGGLIGRLANLFLEVLTDAVERNKFEITLSDLDRASRVASYDMPIGIGTPFAMSFNVTPTTEKISQIMGLGDTERSPVQDNNVSRSIRGRKPRSSSMSDLVRARG